MLAVSQFSAFFGGLLTFLAPCTLPLIPAYLLFIGGGAADPTLPKQKGRIIRNALYFVAGFTVVFMLFGAMSGLVGKTIVANRALFSQIGGVIVIFFGLSMLGVFSLPTLRLFGGKLPSWIHAGSPLSAVLLGVLFALGWSPCIGPILGTILILASTQHEAMYGAYLLFLYALGLGLPFIMLAIGIEQASSRIERLSKYLPMIAKVGGALFIILGILLLVGRYGILTQYFGNLIDITAYDWVAERL